MKRKLSQKSSHVGLSEKHEVLQKHFSNFRSQEHSDITGVFVIVQWTVTLGKNPQHHYVFNYLYVHSTKNNHCKKWLLFNNGHMRYTHSHITCFSYAFLQGHPFVQSFTVRSCIFRSSIFMSCIFLCCSIVIVIFHHACAGPQFFPQA